MLPAPTYDVTRSNVLEHLLQSKGYVAVPAGGAIADVAYAIRPHGRIANISVTETSQYCSKRRFYRILAQHQKTQHIPLTYLRLEDLPSPLPAGVWFLKKAQGSRGEAVYCFTDYAALEAKAEELGVGSYVIQKGVERLDLMAGRKYTLRVYLLQLGDGRYFVYRRIVGIQHKRRYSATCSDYETHIDHKGATRFDLAATHPYYDLLFERILRVCAETFPAFQHQRDIAPSSYHLYGLDFLIDEDLRPWFIEMNGFPNLDSVVDDVREEILVDLFSDLHDLVIAPRLHGSEERIGSFARVN